MLVKVKVLFFGQARELAGKNIDFINVPELVSCSELLDTIVRVYSLQAVKNNILLSINQELYYLEDNLALKENDEVGIIPPLSGG